MQRFAKGLVAIFADKRKYLVEITTSKKQNNYSLLHDVLINGEPVIIESTCLGASPSNIGKNAMDAVIRFIGRLPGQTSHYERLLDGFERRPLQFKSNIKQEPLKYRQEQNNSLLNVIENVIFPKK